ncbi:MAG TPA: hypothetical protein VNM90_07100 [Haliangium sp.]|nr:hypothetical protein [Haliangium sp.]
MLVILVAVPAARATPPQVYPWAQPTSQPPGPPGPPLAPPGATAPARRVPDWASWQIYDASSKSQGLAMVLELFVPGLGSIYAEHWTGAATTWGLAVGGIFLVAWSFGQDTVDSEPGASDSAGLALTAGILMVVGGRVYGLVDSYRASQRYNLALSRRLGLHGGMVLGPIPLQVNGQTSLGLGAAWQF